MIFRRVLTLACCALSLSCALSTARIASAQTDKKIDTTKSDTKKTVATKPASLEEEILAEINLARTKPEEYAKFLEEQKKLYAGKELRRPKREARVTNEGVAALDEAIKALREMKPSPPLKIYVGMSKAAGDHLADIDGKKFTGHKGSNGDLLPDRLSRYGEWDKAIGENIAYRGFAAREMVIDWLIDDGVASRGHRKNVLNSEYTAIGVASGKESPNGRLCVTAFAGVFNDKETVTKK